MNVNALLQELGFSDYEARAYAGLVGAGPRNGYEVAKAAGIPRGNVYAVLERLVERGGARRLDTPEGVRYEAVAPDRLTRQLDKRHRRILAAAAEALAGLEGAAGPAPVFNLKGYKELIEQARVILDATEDELLIALQPAEAGALADPLQAARERGAAITTLCMQACEAECGGCRGRIHRFNLAPRTDSRWLLLVGDGEAIAGEITAQGATAIATRHPQVAELISSYIRQSLGLAILADDAGERFEGLLSVKAREALDSLSPNGDFLARLSDITGKALL